MNTLVAIIAIGGIVMLFGIFVMSIVFNWKDRRDEK